MTSKRDLVSEATVKAKRLQIEEIHSIKAAWDKFDLNGDGVVKKDELDAFLGQLKLPEDKKVVIRNALEKELDGGQIEFVEFVMCYERGILNDI